MLKEEETSGGWGVQRCIYMGRAMGEPGKQGPHAARTVAFICPSLYTTISGGHEELDRVIDVGAGKGTGFLRKMSRTKANRIVVR